MPNKRLERENPLEEGAQKPQNLAATPLPPTPFQALTASLLAVSPEELRSQERKWREARSERLERNR